MTTNTRKPLIALATGDPCGISPELTVKLIADEEIAQACRLLVIGDQRVLDLGSDHAGETVRPQSWKPGDAVDFDGHRLYDLGHGDPDNFPQGEVSLAGGQFALKNFTTALELARVKQVQAVTFTPFNKQAMRLARPGYDDEVAVTTEGLAAKKDGREFNILEGLWNARVTSHIPLKDVSAALSVDTLVNAGDLANQELKLAGFKAPRIAVAGLNPHAGDGGAFGREDIDIIEPAVKAMVDTGISAVGPVPADTVFVRAKAGEFDAVLTMYHDQGQIAMKLLGFDAGVTLIGGYAVPVCTPAHGTAYDIAGQGKANKKAACNAVKLAAKMAEQRALS